MHDHPEEGIQSMLHMSDGHSSATYSGGRDEDGAQSRLTVVLLEDDADYATALGDYLRTSGFNIEIVAVYPALAGTLKAAQPDVLVADQFVAGVDIGQRLEAIRAQFAGPIMMLTGNDDPVDRVICLERGADDFIVKAKATPREVLARVRAVLRRTAGSAEAKPAGGQIGAIQISGVEVSVDDWVLSDRHRTLANPAGDVVRLTGAERDTLWLLMSRRGTVVARDEAMEAVLRRKIGPHDRSIDNLVSRCRRFAAELGGTMDIETVRGVGYKLTGFTMVRPAGTNA